MTEAVETRQVAPPATATTRRTPSRRDLRLDFFRGLSLFFIFIDHIPANVLTYVTLHSLAFCDAADVFIFISGYTAALVYGQAQKRGGWLIATAQVYRRVWQLYVAHVFLFVIFTAEVSYALISVRNPMYAEELGVGDFLNAPHIAVMHALVLDFQPPFLDILPLYILLLGSFPLVLIGLAKNRVLPLALSFVLYVLTLWQGWTLHTYPDDQAWFFNPLAWQFLFVIGATFGYGRTTGAARPALPRWFTAGAAVLAAIIAVISFTWMLHWVYDPFPPLFVKLYYYTTDKRNLAPMRLLSFLALAAGTLHFVRPDSAFLHTRAARLVIICGQNSLYVFCVGILLSVFARFVLAEINSRVGMQIAVNLVGFALMIGVAALLQWYKTASRAASSGAPASAE